MNVYETVNFFKKQKSYIRLLQSDKNLIDSQCLEFGTDDYLNKILGFLDLTKPYNNFVSTKSNIYKYNVAVYMYVLMEHKCNGDIEDYCNYIVELHKNNKLWRLSHKISERKKLRQKFIQQDLFNYEPKSL